jgi:hypothetical protein
MANGTAVTLLSELDPIPAPASTLPGDQAKFEVSVGMATADAVTALSAALSEFQNGGLSAASRERGGERIARLYTILQAAPAGLDPAVVARVEGKRVLLARHGAEFRALHGVEFPERALDIFIDEALAVVGKVTAFERAMAH